MAGDAAHVDAEEYLRVRDRELVDGVGPVHEVVRVFVFRVVFRFDEVTREVQCAGRGMTALAALAEQIASDVGVWPVEPEPLFDPVMEEIAAEAHAIAGAEQVFEVVGPAIDEVLAVDEPVDKLFALLRVFVTEECREFGDRWDVAGCVEPCAPRELFIRRQARMRDTLLLDPFEDVFVDEIGSRNGPGYRFGWSQSLQSAA